MSKLDELLRCSVCRSADLLFDGIGYKCAACAAYNTAEQVNATRDAIKVEQPKPLRERIGDGSWHFIQGPNGRCACGVYDGEVIDCARLLEIALSDEVLQQASYIYVHSVGDDLAAMRRALIDALRSLHTEPAEGGRRDA